MHKDNENRYTDSQYQKKLLLLLSISLKEFAGVEGEIGAAPGSVATPISVDPFSLRMTFTVEVWAIYDICVVLYAVICFAHVSLVSFDILEAVATSFASPIAAL